MDALPQDVLDAYRLSNELLEGFWHGLKLDGHDINKRHEIDGATLLYIVLYFGVAQFAMNWGVRLLFIEPLARVFLSKNGQPAKTAKVQKFAQSAVEALTYGMFTVFGLLIVPYNEFFWPSTKWWIHKLEKQPMQTDAVWCFYILYFTRYVQAGISVTMEHRRKDFVEMMAHHVVTAAVVAISYFGYVPVGLVIMVLFDPADVPLHTAKCLKYLAECRPMGGVRSVLQFGSNRSFEVFAVSFFVTRLVMYPYVMWSCHVESQPLGAQGNIAIVLLWILLGLNVYWFYLIIRVVVKMAVNGDVEVCRFGFFDLLLQD